VAYRSSQGHVWHATPPSWEPTSPVACTCGGKRVGEFRWHQPGCALVAAFRAQHPELGWWGYREGEYGPEPDPSATISEGATR
jgi:hypothetical protein